MNASNRMSKLLDKIEIWLGTKPLNLPDDLKKGDAWVRVIDILTLDTFSRYFPNKFRIELGPHCKKGDYYLIDEDMFSGLEILGVRDIAWDDFTPASSMINSTPYGIYDFMNSMTSLEDIGLMQTRADHVSLFNNGLYLDFESPNKVKISTASNARLGNSMDRFKVDVLIKHAINLNTIAPTKMETFEKLAKADVAGFLYNNLKMFDGMDTIYGNIELRLNELEQIANSRENIEQELKDGYVSASNDNQPIVFTV